MPTSRHVRTIEDFDQALFGRTFQEVDWFGRTVKTGLDPNGVFANWRKEEPTYAGVLGFIGVGFLKCSNPVLYKHPRFSGSLPKPLDLLECRHYNSKTNEIEIIPQAGDVMEGLNFVQNRVS